MVHGDLNLDNVLLDDAGRISGIVDFGDLSYSAQVGDFAIVGVAAQVSIDASGICTRAGIGLTNVAPTPLQAQAAEAFLQGKRLDQDNIRQAAQLAAEAARPEADLRGSVEYKRDMVRVLTIRALTGALERASGQRA